MLRFFKQNGFNLVEVMIAGALVAGLGLAAANIFSKQTEANKYNRLLTDLNTYHSNLRRIYSDVRNCNALLSGAAFGFSGQPVTNIAPAIKALHICCPAGNSTCEIPPGNTACLETDADNNIVLLSQNIKEIVRINRNIALPRASTTTEYTHPDIRLIRMRFWDLAANTYASSITSKTPGTKFYELHINYRLRAKGGRSEIRKTIPLGVRFGSNGHFQGCVSEASSTKDSFTREICEAINAQSGGQILVKWEKGEEGVERCVRVKTDDTHACPAGEVFLGLSSTGEAHCGVPTDYIDPAELINSASVGGCSSAAEIKFLKGHSGKVHVRCDAPPTTGGTSGGGCICSDWGPWSSCVSGNKTRTRTCTGCDPMTITGEIQLCVAECLPMNGTWSYTSWSSCNPLTLTQTRSTISCNGASCGGTCGTPVTTQPCSCIWSPPASASNIRTGHCVIQNNGCGATREVWGTCNLGPGQCMENAQGPGCHY